MVASVEALSSVVESTLSRALCPVLVGISGAPTGPIIRVSGWSSKSGPSRPRIPGPRSLRAAPPLSANRGDSLHLRSSSMCIREEHMVLSALSLSLPLPSSPSFRVFSSTKLSRSFFLPLLLHLFLLVLKTSERIHGASRTYFSVHTIIVGRTHKWYQVRACS